MITHQQPDRSQLFTLRVWLEEGENGRLEMRGTVRHVLSGETRHFRDMHLLKHFIEHVFLTTQADAPGGIS